MVGFLAVLVSGGEIATVVIFDVITNKVLAGHHPQIQALTGYRAALAEGQASAGRVTEILEFTPAVADGVMVRSRVRSRGRIDFENVSFGYPGAGYPGAGYPGAGYPGAGEPGAGEPAVEGLSFTAQPGRVLAVTGPSGAGKSTIARLLLRDAPVLILDEPSTGLDPASTARLMPLLRTVTDGRAVILITHDRALAAAADDVLTLGAAPGQLTGPAGLLTAT